MSRVVIGMDPHKRSATIEVINELITGTGMLTTTKRAELRGIISTKPGLNRYLYVGGTPRSRHPGVPAAQTDPRIVL